VIKTVGMANVLQPSFRARRLAGVNAFPHRDDPRVD